MYTNEEALAIQQQEQDLNSDTAMLISGGGDVVSFI